MKLRHKVAMAFMGAVAMMTASVTPAGALPPLERITGKIFFDQGGEFRAVLGYTRATSIQGVDSNGDGVAYAAYSPDMPARALTEEFPASGEVFRIEDLTTDRFEVGLHWRLVDGSRRGLCVFSNKLTYEASGYCDPANIAEGEIIEFRVGRCNLDAHDCTVLGNWNSWSQFQRYKDDAGTDFQNDCREPADVCNG